MPTRPITAYKILTADQMTALESGEFPGAPVDQQDGYIHLSTRDQLTQTVDKHFAGQSDLWVAAVDLDAHGEAISWEPSRNGEDFPHLYGRLTLETVIAYSPLEREDDGTIRLPVTG